MDIGVNYRDGDFVEAVRKRRTGRACDLVVDSVGGKTLEGSILCVGYRGRVITVGNVSREGKGIDIGPLSRRERLAHGRVLRPRDVPQRRARRADDEPAPARHREGRAEGGRRPHVPAVRGGRRARVHRVAGGVRARGAGAVRFQREHGRSSSIKSQPDVPSRGRASRCGMR